MLQNRVPPPVLAAACAAAIWGISKIAPGVGLSLPWRVALASPIALIGIYLASPWALVGVAGFVIYIDLLQVRREERVLATLFGPDYERYKASVRRWL